MFLNLELFSGVCFLNLELFSGVCFQMLSKEIVRSHVTCLFAGLTVGAVKKHEQDTLLQDKGQNCHLAALF